MGAVWAASRNPTVVWIWAAGILVFLGLLYILALTNIRWLVAFTPIGGVLFLAGWLLVAIDRNDRQAQSSRLSECETATILPAKRMLITSILP